MKRIACLISILGISCTTKETIREPSPSPLSTIGQEYTVVLQRGLNAYNGVRDTTLDFDDPTGNYGFEQVRSTNDFNTGQYRIGTFYYDLQPVMNDFPGRSPCDLTVVEARWRIFYLNYQSSTNGPVYDITAFPEDGPRFVETEANVNEASAGVPWSGVGDDFYINSFYPAPFSGIIDVPIPSEIIERWLCDPTLNKGWQVTVGGSPVFNGDGIYISSSEATIEPSGVSRRPSLIIRAR